MLALNVERARMWKVYERVLAADIVRGTPPPLEYFRLFDKGDPKVASQMRGDALLVQLMGSVR